MRTFSFVSFSVFKSLKLFIAPSKASKQDWIVEFTPQALDQEEKHGVSWRHLKGAKSLGRKERTGEKRKGEDRRGGEGRRIRGGDKREAQRRDSWRHQEQLCRWP